MIFEMPISRLPKLFLLTSFMILGCTTPYKKLGKNGGYSDEKVNDRVYKVSFEGNTHTNDEKVRTMFLRRSAEIAHEHNFSYFSVIDSEELTKNVRVVSEGSTPVTKARITALSYSGNTTFLPTVQKNIHNHLIEGTIALFHDGEQPLDAYKVENILNKYTK